MNNYSSVRPGIIEGFFGRSWSWQDRKEYAEFLASNGYSYYIYAPKSDACLRKHWRSPWPQATFAELHKLRDHYRQQQVAFGVGLSPYEIHLDSSTDKYAQLLQKIGEINQLQPDILCLLFDDMRGDFPQLAQVQRDLIHFTAQHSSAQQIIFCPTYYSFDPVLEKVFGTRPADYWETLGRDIDPHIDIFWTGPKVCSEEYTAAHLKHANDLLGRKVFLWDNYPVNDGAIKSKLLQLRAFGRSHAQLTELVSGHAVNPMNQAWLSRLSLTTLPRAYQEQQHYNPEQAFIDSCHQLCDAPLAQYLIEDIELLQNEGLDKLDAEQREILRKKYAAFDNNPYAREIIDWLNDEYQFDPSCLTE